MSVDKRHLTLMVVHIVGIIVSTALVTSKCITGITHISCVISALIVFFIVQKYLEKKRKRERTMERSTLRNLMRLSSRRM